MRLRHGIAIALAVIASTGVGADTTVKAPAPALPPGLTHVVDPVINALWSGFDLTAAQDHVKFVTQYWRLPGNPGFDATIDRVHARLRAAGFKDRVPGAPASPTPEVWVEEYQNPTKGWDHSIGTLALVQPGRTDRIVLSRANERLALCINSFSTPPAGVTAKLVDVGKGDQESDYANRDVTGAVVLGDGDVGQLWRNGVMRHGAIGVVSGAIGEYVNPNGPTASSTPRDTWNILQWGSIPYDEARKGFGFKATPHAIATMRQALAAGAVTVRVTIASTFSTKPARTLVAEIPGRVVPTERVVLAVHVQEPGANDNASGVATLAEVARSLNAGIGQGRIPPPARTLTLLWLDEIAGSRQWLVDHQDQARSVKYMFSMDMTGEDVKKTGGSFLIERYPDPGAVWDRPWDPHTEWGRGQVQENQLKGDLLNDLHLAICLRVAKKSGWVVNTNPYEGGSDHTVFGTAGIPSVLDWHFTDRYYHTNLDTADKSSATEMRNVGVSAVSTAWLLASAREPVAIAVAEFVEKAGLARVTLEEREGARLAATDTDQAAARLREDQIVTAWKKWYAEAVQSVSRLIVGQPSPAFQPRLQQLAAPFVDTAPTRVLPPAVASDDGFRIVPASLMRPIGQSARPLTREMLELVLDRLQADRSYPAPKANSTVSVDQGYLNAGLVSADAVLRRIAVRGMGRFEDPANVSALIGALADRDAKVRAEAANAIAQSLMRNKGPDVLPGAEALLARSQIETDAHTQATMRESLARLHYSNPQEEARVLAAIITDPDAAVVLLRADRTLQVSDGERQILLKAVQPPDMVSQGSATALEALVIAGAADFPLIHWALTSGRIDRYAAVQFINPSDPQYAPDLESALHDFQATIRLSALRKYGSTLKTTQNCAPMIDRIKDADEWAIVKLEAISLLDPGCMQRDELQAMLLALVGDMTTEWHLGARALETLARFDAGEAKRVLTDVAIISDVWQVRAAAARVALTLRDEPTLIQLTADAEPNVATEALVGLTRLKSQAVQELALKLLDSPDYQLVRQSALSLLGDKRADVVAPRILETLDRLTREGKDTSRDPRLALLLRLKDLAPADSTGTSPIWLWTDKIRAYLSDFDPNVASAAADILGVILGKRPDQTPTRRPLIQPTEDELKQLPGDASIGIEGSGQMCMQLLTDEAPLVVARFVKLSKAGYYDGLTFHRVVPLFVVQGGSPHANEYAGDARYLRDEIGLIHHTQGAVGLSTRGRDTADAQIFIDLTDQPRLDHEYTVFGHLYDDPKRCSDTSSTLGHILEGAKITSVTIRVK